MPPAFILSQDQTLHKRKSDRPPRGGRIRSWFYNSKQGMRRLAAARLTSSLSFYILFCIALHCAARFSRSRSAFSAKTRHKLALFPFFANRHVVFFWKTGVFYAKSTRGRRREPRDSPTAHMQEGMDASARAFCGKVNPAGRLPVTFYKSVNDLPPFTDYSIRNRTYRFFRGKCNICSLWSQLQ